MKFLFAAALAGLAAANTPELSDGWSSTLQEQDAALASSRCNIPVIKQITADKFDSQYRFKTPVILDASDAASTLSSADLARFLGTVGSVPVMLSHPLARADVGLHPENLQTHVAGFRSLAEREPAVKAAEKALYLGRDEEAFDDEAATMTSTMGWDGLITRAHPEVHQALHDQVFAAAGKKVVKTAAPGALRLSPLPGDSGESVNVISSKGKETIPSLVCAAHSHAYSASKPETCKCGVAALSATESGRGSAFRTDDGAHAAVQLHGSKRYFIAPGAVPGGFNHRRGVMSWVKDVYAELPESSFKAGKDSHPELYECTLRPGQALYIPPGFTHASLAVGHELSSLVWCEEGEGAPVANGPVSLTGLAASENEEEAKRRAVTPAAYVPAAALGGKKKAGKEEVTMASFARRAALHRYADTNAHLSTDVLTNAGVKSLGTALKAAGYSDIVLPVPGSAAAGSSPATSGVATPTPVPLPPVVPTSASVRRAEAGMSDKKNQAQDRTLLVTAPPSASTSAAKNQGVLNPWSLALEDVLTGAPGHAATLLDLQHAVNMFPEDTGLLSALASAYLRLANDVERRGGIEEALAVNNEVSANAEHVQVDETDNGPEEFGFPSRANLAAATAAMTEKDDEGFTPPQYLGMSSEDHDNYSAVYAAAQRNLLKRRGLRTKETAGMLTVPLMPSELSFLRQAVVLLEDAIRLNHRHPEAWVLLADAYASVAGHALASRNAKVRKMAWNYFDRALAAAQHATRLDPSSASACNSVALYTRRGGLKGVYKVDAATGRFVATSSGTDTNDFQPNVRADGSLDASNGAVPAASVRTARCDNGDFGCYMSVHAQLADCLDVGYRALTHAASTDALSATVRDLASTTDVIDELASQASFGMHAAAYNWMRRASLRIAANALPALEAQAKLPGGAKDSIEAAIAPVAALHNVDAKGGIPGEDVLWTTATQKLFQTPVAAHEVQNVEMFYRKLADTGRKMRAEAKMKEMMASKGKVLKDYVAPTKEEIAEMDSIAAAEGEPKAGPESKGKKM